MCLQMMCSSYIHFDPGKTKIIQKVPFEEHRVNKFFFVKFFELEYFSTMDD